jgi:hypothetical protein
MGCRIMQDVESGQACFYCSTTDWAFGPLFPSREAAELFLKTYPDDPRSLSEKDLEVRFSAFVHQYVCECGELRDEDNADRMAYIAYPEGCRCENNGDWCDWCSAKNDVIENWESKDCFQCSYCWQKQACNHA